MKSTTFVTPFLLFCLLTTVVHTQPSSEYPPAVMFSAMLKGVKVLPEKGMFRMDNLQTVFLPDAQSNSIYPYNPDDGGKLYSILRRTDGSVVATFTWYAEKRKPPYWLLSSYKIKAEKADQTTTGSWLTLTTPGDYELEFLLGEKPFYLFTFSLEELKSGDPYSPGSIYRLNGPWNKYAYLYYQDANPDRPLMFKIWLRNKGQKKKQDVKVTGSMLRNGKEVATFGERPQNLSLSADWIRYEFNLGHFGKSKWGSKIYNNFMRANEFLAKNGKYTIKVKIDNKLYATFPFRIKDNKIVYHQDQDRQKNNSISRIEGGKDAWWLKAK